MSGGLVKITVTEQGGSNRQYNQFSFSGRFLGLASREDMKAIINTKDAARKLFSSESVGLHILEGEGYTAGTRVVVATTFFSNDIRRAVYISPPIRYAGWEAGKKKYYCGDDTSISLEEI